MGIAPFPTGKEPFVELADPELAAWLESQRGAPPMRAQSVADLRAGADARAATRPAEPELPVVTDLVVPAEGVAVPVRLYRPDDGPGPVVVFLHGGGGVFGSIATHDRAARRLAATAGLAVLSVGYRLAPENPWPAAVDDALAVIRWARAEGRPVVLAGDSAGGLMAAVACLRLRDAGEPQPAGQALAFPNTDLTFARPSVAAKATGWGLDADDARHFAALLVPDEARRADPRVSPLLEPDLTGLAPAVVVTAEHDPLKDEGDAYAARLAEAGVPVAHRTEPGMVHGFLTFDTVSPAAAAAGTRFFEDVGRLARSGQPAR
jgi:acetyl esterase/lipase